MLVDLQAVEQPLIEKINRFKGIDCTLPQSFTSKVSRINNDVIQFGVYNSCVTTPSGLHIFLSNNWFYLAAILLPLHAHFGEYKNVLLRIVGKQLLKEKDVPAIESAVDASNEDDQDKLFLKRFVSDYNWWNGGHGSAGKTLDRDDCFVSAILSLAGVLNSSQGYIAVLWDFLGTNLSLASELNSQLERLLETNNQEQISYQKVFFGAPGTGKSFSVKKDVVEIPLNSTTRRNAFESSLFCKTGYDRYLSDVITNNICNPYEVNSLQALKELHKNVLSSNIVNCKDPASALNNYIDFVSDNCYRITFHPEYDYAQFVGTYKPIWDDSSKKVKYDFVAGPFIEAYLSAWKRFVTKDNVESSEKVKVFLVIEEINRGNCAQIFGDVFQLLDRDEQGFSRYSINVGEELASYICQRLNDFDGKTGKAPKNGPMIDHYLGFSYIDDEGKTRSPVGVDKIALPPNLCILATMNTSDQSLFPMDSAFKRRFDWKYVPIDYNQPKANFIVDLGDGKTFSWLKFLKLVNDDIYEVTKSEDKQMGEFFIRPSDGVIKLEEFCSKVLFYLWDSVYKDETSYDKVFHFKHPKFENKTVTFQGLFVEDQKYAVDIISRMIDNLEKDASPNEKIKKDGNFEDLLNNRNPVAEDVVEEESSDEAVETVVEEDLPKQE